MSIEIDATLAPPGFRARLQTREEREPLTLPSCTGCFFHGKRGSYGLCADFPCCQAERPDGEDVVFELT